MGGLQRKSKGGRARLSSDVLGIRSSGGRLGGPQGDLQVLWARLRERASVTLGDQRDRQPPIS